MYGLTTNFEQAIESCHVLQREVAVAGGLVESVGRDILERRCAADLLGRERGAQLLVKAPLKCELLCQPRDLILPGLELDEGAGEFLADRWDVDLG